MPAHDARRQPTVGSSSRSRDPRPASQTSLDERHGGRRSAALGAVLSFLFPGLGQAAGGAVRRGAIIAAPALLLVAALAVAWIVDRGVLVRAALTPTILLAIIGLSLAVLIYRLWAILDAYVLNRRGDVWARTTSIGQFASVSILVAVVGATVFMHGWVAYLGWSGHQALVAVFDPDGPGDLGGSVSSLEPTPSPAVPTPGTHGGPVSTEPTPTAIPTPATPSPTVTPGWAADNRLNVLLIGSDAGPGRWSMRADAIILTSIQVDTGRVAAFSLPRYTRNVPLPEPAASAFECRCLSDDYINALYVYANQHPDLFPGATDVERGLTALGGAIEALFGVTLDGIAVADLNGFVSIVDALGGIRVDVPSAVYDPEYPTPDGSGSVEVSFAPGVQQMDGWHALAYARTRHQDGDVARMQRQQIVVQAIGRELKCDLVGNLPGLLDVARESLWTSVPLESVPDMIQIDLGPVESHVLFDTHNVTLTPDDVARIQGEVEHAFDGPAPTPPPDTAC